MKPNVVLPETPKNIFSLWKKPKLNNIKIKSETIKKVDNSKLRIGFVKKENIKRFIIPKSTIPAAKPSKPSIKLIEFVNPITNINVKIILK